MVVKRNVGDSEGYEPYFPDVVEGNPAIQMQRLRQAGSHDNPFLTGAFFADGPCVVRSTPSGDEAAYIIEGEVVLSVDGEPDLVLSPGDMAFIPRGTNCTWQITRAPFREFFVLGE